VEILLFFEAGLKASLEVALHRLKVDTWQQQML
jgi:hypothetical protein